MELFFAGLIASFIGSLLGLGGGFVLVPLLSSGFGMPMKDSVFLSLISIFILSVLQNFFNRHLIREHRKALISLSVVCVGSSVLFSWIGTKTPEVWLHFLFALFLIMIGLHYLRRDPQIFSSISLKNRSRVAHLSMTGAGVLSGMFGVGGGILSVPILNQILSFSLAEAAKLSFFVQLFAAGSSLLTHYHLRKAEIIEISPLAPLLLVIGSVSGFILSRRVKLSNANLKRLFAVIILAIGISKLLQNLFAWYFPSSFEVP